MLVTNLFVPWIFCDKSVDKVHGEMKELNFRVLFCRLLLLYLWGQQVNVLRMSFWVICRSSLHLAFPLLLLLFDRANWIQPSHTDICNIVFFCRLSKEWRQEKLWPVWLLHAYILPYGISVRIDHTVQLCTVEYVVNTWSGLGLTPKECGMNLKPHMSQ